MKVADLLYVKTKLAPGVWSSLNSGLVRSDPLGEQEERAKLFFASKVQKVA